jgi:NhaP-type Na+/H+ or K+/H+ antiporter
MFWEDTAFVANSLIFLMLGLSEMIFLSHTHNNPKGLLYPVLIAIVVVLLARFVVVCSLVPLVNSQSDQAVARKQAGGEYQRGAVSTNHYTPPGKA